MIDTHRANPVSRNAPIRILHLITTLDVGGAEVMLWRLLAALDPERFSNRVVCMAKPGEIGNRIAASGIPVDDLGFPLGRVTFAGILKWIHLLRRIRPEIVQSWMYHANLLGLSAPLVLGRTRLFWNIQASGRDPSEFKALTRGVIRITRCFSGFPEAVIVNSEKGRADHLRMGYKDHNLHVIPNGFDLSAYAPLDATARRQVRRTCGMDEDAFCVGMFARYHPVKDHATALKAARRVREKGYNAHFYFAGAGVDSDNPMLSRRISTLDLVPYVHLLGYQEQTARLMAAMDAVISCSHSEGLSNVIGEAMAAGVPCIVTDVGDSARVVGDNGKIVRPRDPEALARAVMEMIRMPLEARQRLGDAARARIRRHYAISAVAEAYTRLYEPKTSYTFNSKGR